MKEVIISISGLQSLDGDAGDKVEFVTDGKYSFENGIAEFRYSESELTGLEGTQTSFVASPQEVSLTRAGTVNMQMLFHEGQRHYFVYDTPYGAFTMGIDTQSILFDLDEHGGTLEVKYCISMEHMPASRNNFRINIREAK